MNQEENTTFIGFGNMGSAIVKAIDKDKCFKQCKNDDLKINIFQKLAITFLKFLLFNVT